MAQWFGTTQGAPFEGGMLILEKRQEEYSDKDGMIFIKDYWKRNKFSWLCS
jgi:hypothetical protein